MSEILNTDNGFRSRVAVISGGVVTNVIEKSPNIIDGITSDTAQIGDFWNDKTMSFKNFDEHRLELLKNNVQKRLDSFACTKNYSGIDNLCSQSTSADLTVLAEANCGITLRDATWAKYAGIELSIKNQTRPYPENFSEVENELPALGWTN
jgi:hypothetical protein